MSEPKCPKCQGDSFLDPEGVVVTRVHGVHVECRCPLHVCFKCQNTFLTVNEHTALFAKLEDMYNQLRENPNEHFKLDAVEERDRKVVCDNCSEDWTGRPGTGGFIYDNDAYCPSCCARALFENRKHWDITQIQKCPPELSFADWVLKFCQDTGQTQIKHWSRKQF